MKATLILSLLSISMILARTARPVTLLKHKVPVQQKINEETINFFTIPTEKDVNNVPKEIQIKSTLISSNKQSELVPIMVASYKPLPNADKDSQLLLGGLGEEVKIESDFINKADKNEIYVGVFGQNCTYEIIANILNSTSTNVLLAGPKNVTRPLRSLVEEPVKNGNETDYSNKTRLDYYRADGISALIVAFTLIFVSIIACVIMMNTYVHTSALVEKPLKLGRVEA